MNDNDTIFFKIKFELFHKNIGTHFSKNQNMLINRKKY